MVKNKPSYNMWQNSLFMLRHTGKVPRSRFLPVWILLSAFAAFLLSVANAYLPKTILAAIEQEVKPGTLVGIIVGYTLILVLLAAAVPLLERISLIPRMRARIELGQQLDIKKMTTDYENLYCADFNTKFEKGQRALENGEASGEQIYRVFCELLAQGLGFLFFLLLLTRVNYFLLLVSAVTALTSYFYNKKVEQSIYERREEYNPYAAKLGYLKNKVRDVSCAKDIRLFGMQKWFSDMYLYYTDLCIAFQRKNEKKRLAVDCLGIVFTFLRNGIAYLYLIRLVSAKDMAVSDFVLYFAAVGTFTQYVSGLFGQLEELHKHSLTICYVRDTLDYPERFKREDGKALQACDIPYEIELQKVTFRYPEAGEDTIKGIDLTIHPGEKLAVIGLNGAGKTTLVKLICGLLDPTAGRILLNGVDIREYNRLDYYRILTTLFQEFSVLPNTIAENIAQEELEALDAAKWKKIRQCGEKAGLAEKIRELPKGYETPITRDVYDDGVEFSGGQMQSLMLARALYKNAPIMILDEPTAALDPIAESRIYQKYSDLTKGRTSVYISHRLASTQFCDRVLLLEKGRIAEEGSHSDLMKKGGKYAELYEIQSHYYREGARENEG